MQRNILSLKDLSQKDILAIFQQADEFKRKILPYREVSAAKVGGHLFFEPSTRTRIGFEVAAWKLGIKTVNLHDTKLSQSMSQAESVPDTVRTLDAYVDYYCIRHPKASIFKEILPYTKKTVINCGNGYDEHPTQALIDGYAMWDRFGGINDLNITLIGTPRYSRSAHSLLLLLAKFSNVTINEVAPEKLKVQRIYKDVFMVNKNQYRNPEKHKWGYEQVVYSTGFSYKNPKGIFSQEVRDRYKVTATLARNLSSDCIILNPLPRIDEIDTEVDNLPAAYYFQQNALGLYIRMAIIEHLCL